MARLSIRIDLSPDARLGPGKIRLLEAIQEHGSISAAARALGMSYRRAWDLVTDLNRIFDLPVVQAQTGGRSGGSAEVTPFGGQLIARYRALETKALQAVSEEIDAITTAAKTSRTAP